MIAASPRSRMDPEVDGLESSTGRSTFYLTREPEGHIVHRRHAKGSATQTRIEVAARQRLDVIHPLCQLDGLWFQRDATGAQTRPRRRDMRSCRWGSAVHAP
eukprot:CAMPEP_0184382016 /NCGR_PEP_ID=MMETSP0007-20130409/5992_1 /TAXON_ID=97485 /ORGANISM="Prymnesium parvum, Strain Texoma1" /LENGTH=101 /DNA_ID=CAMNT_0026727885 /DNA_START=342 /DNA_END=648 /DNA_ORIENTATION=+